MDLIKQEETLAKIDRLLKRTFKGNIFHLVMTIETAPGQGTVVASGTLDKRSPHEAWKTLITGLRRHCNEMEEKLNSSEDITIIKPLSEL